jgi:hypothetical protein
MSTAGQQLPSMAVSNDFNARLLNRVAQERFAETRSKAFLPRRAPILRWTTAIPAFVTTSVVVLLAFVAFSGQFPHQGGLTANSKSGLDESYRTVQPICNANNTMNLNKNWSLNRQLAQAEKMYQISRVIIRQGAWGNFERSSGLLTASTGSSRPLPYRSNHYRVRPVVRRYVSPESPAEKETKRAF